MDNLFKQGAHQPISIKLYHTAHCYSHTTTEESRVYMVYSPEKINNQVQQSLILHSEAPFEQWQILELTQPIANLPVLGLAQDVQRRTTSMLLHDPNQVNIYQ